MNKNINLLQRQCLFIWLISLLFLSPVYAQVISSSVLATVTATGGDFTVNSGVTVGSSGSTASPAVSVNGVSVTNFINNGSILTSVSGGQSLYFNSTAALANITNNGTMTSKDGIGLYSPANIVNNGSFLGTNIGITLSAGATGSSITNSDGAGLNGFTQSYSAIRNNAGAAIVAITNGTGSTIRGLVPIDSSGAIATLTNRGTISSMHWVSVSAIYGSGTITDLINYGTITPAGSASGISNTVVNLANAQGAAPLSIQNQPTTYAVIINSPTSYGKLSINTVTGNLSGFSIYAGSTVSAGTYSSVLSGISATNLTATKAGTYSGYSWSLTNSSGSIWDLIVTGSGSSGGSSGGGGASSAYRSNTLSYLRNHAANAAGMLDSLSTSTGSMAGVITALNNLSGATQANAISQTLPVITGASSQATTSSMQALNQIVQGRSNSLRGMASGDEYIGNRDMWMKGFGSWANQNDVNGVAGYKVNTGGLAIGVDQGFTPKLNIGAVLALSNSGVSSNSSSAPSGVTINSYQAGVYGDYAIDPKIIANAQADIGLNQNKEYRNITFMGTNANGTYNSYSAHLGTGVKYLMPIDMENTFIPSVRVDYTTVQSQAYSESGAGALNLSVAKQTYNTLIPSADVRIDHSLDSKMTLSANAGAGYNTLNNQVSATSAYAGGGTTFATNGLQVSPWLYNAGVGVTGQIDKNLQLNIRYDNVFSPTGYMNQMVSAKLKIPL